MVVVVEAVAFVVEGQLAVRDYISLSTGGLCFSFYFGCHDHGLCLCLYPYLSLFLDHDHGHEQMCYRHLSLFHLEALCFALPFPPKPKAF